MQYNEQNNHECVKLVHETSVQEQYIHILFMIRSRTTNARMIHEKQVQELLNHGWFMKLIIINKIFMKQTEELMNMRVVHEQFKCMNVIFINPTEVFMNWLSIHESLMDCS